MHGSDSTFQPAKRGSRPRPKSESAYRAQLIKPLQHYAATPPPPPPGRHPPAHLEPLGATPPPPTLPPGGVDALLQSLRSDNTTTTTTTLSPSDVLLCPDFAQPRPGPLDLTTTLPHLFAPQKWLVSQGSVLHSVGSLPPTEMTLEEWQRERDVWSRVAGCRFFRQLPLRRALARWRSGIRRSAFHYARRQLHGRVMLLHSTAGPCIRSVHRILHDAAHTPLLNLALCMTDRGTHRECSFEEFAEAQRISQSQAVGSLTKFTSDALQVVQQAVAQLTDDSPPPGADAEQMQGEEEGGRAGEDGGVNAAHLQRILRNAVVARKLDRVCRMVVSEKSVQHCMEWSGRLVSLCEDLKHAAGGAQPHLLLRSRVEIAADGYLVIPTRDAFSSTILNAFHGATAAVSEAVAEAAPQVSSLVAEAQPFRHLESRIHAAVDRTFGITVDYAESLGEVKRWVDWGARDWPLQKETWVSNMDLVTVGDFKEVFGCIGEANRALKVKLSNVHIGVIRVNHAALRSSLLPGLTVINAWVQQALVEVTRVRATRIKAEILECLTTLHQRHTQLDDWAAWLDSLHAVQGKTEAILTKTDEVQHLHEVIESSFSPCPDDVTQLHTALHIDGNEPPPPPPTPPPPAEQGGSAEKAAKAKPAPPPPKPPLREQYLASLGDAEDFAEKALADRKEALTSRVQGLKDQLREKSSKLSQGAFVSPAEDPSEVLELLSVESDAIDKLRAAGDTCTSYQKLCGFDVASWEELDHASWVLGKRVEIWKTLREYEQLSDTSLSLAQSEIDIEALGESIDNFHTLCHTIASSMPEPDDLVCQRLLKRIEGDMEILPLYRQLSSPAMNSRHWNSILTGCGLDAWEDATQLTMKDLLALKIHENTSTCEQIAVIAAGEYGIQCNISDIEAAWGSTKFELTQHSSGSYVLGRVDEVIQQLDDHQVQVQALLASRFISGVSSAVEEWAVKLQVVSDCLEEWLQVQKSWIYLEFIFSSPDIHEQLPEEAAMFASIDAEFKGLCEETHSKELVILVASKAECLKMLQRANKELDVIQKRLESYLEKKRAVFPRFYFLSNDELLSILSDVRNAAAIQPHLAKIFDNIKQVGFGAPQHNTSPATSPPEGDEADSDGEPPPAVITTMIATEGERVPFETPILPVGGVENWLLRIESTMKVTVRECLFRALRGYTGREGRAAWFFGHPAQSVTCIDMLMWTAEVEEAIASHSLPEYLVGYKEQLAETVNLVEQDLSGIQRGVVCTVILIDVHARDCTAGLIEKNITTVEDFEWARQLRYYEDGSDCIIRHCSADFIYGYEYLGAQGRLVITPLTDRAFLTCTGALSMNLGAAPQGPAGTGKTESVKDLGKALARQVVVFNCSDGLNHRMMSQMFSGLAQAGAWACFDEFNRIPLEVLSVVAQQMLEITAALGAGKASIMFTGRHINLNKNFGVFITMNPGYAGRTELPDNLKALFRPVCMMIPDYSLIAEVMFFSEGFLGASTLARKMVQLYKLSSEQLSKQDHYDFGMRAVKSILVCAGSLKRASPTESEAMLLIKAMRDSNIPKFLCEDTALFAALITDLFPETIARDSPNEQLVRLIIDSLKRGGYQPVPTFIDKVVQLYDTITVRHGVMTVGQTMTGKSVLLETLKASLIRGNRRARGANKGFYDVVSCTLNPKSITMGELYGEVNPMTQEWHDGIFSKIARGVVDEASNGKLSGRRWMVFDGPVDTLWSENLNTVLDDNRMLCLVNGERIKMPQEASFIFEVQDLKVASPATVSRCGMVFIEPFYLNGGWLPVAESDIQRHANLWDTQLLTSLLEACIPGTLDFLRKNCSESIKSCDVQLVISLLNLLRALVMRYNKIRGVGCPEGDDPSGALGAPSRAASMATLPSRRQSLARLTRHQCVADAAAGDATPHPAEAGGGMLALPQSIAATATTGSDEEGPPHPSGEASGQSSVAGSARGGGGGGGGGGGVDPQHIPLTPHSSSDTASQDSPGRASHRAPHHLIEKEVFCKLYAMAYIYSLGANVTDSGRGRFQEFAARNLADVCDMPLFEAGGAGGEEGGGGGGGVSGLFGLSVDLSSGGWTTWAAQIPHWEYRVGCSFYDLVVPTQETVMCTSLLSLLTEVNSHVLLNGPTGVGKSVMVQSFVFDTLHAGAPDSSWAFLDIVFSAQTSSRNLQDKLESKLHKKRNALYGAPPGKRMLLSLDDMNMPALELFGASPPIELVRQVIGQNGFYDMKKLVFKAVEDIVVVGACGLPGGGRSDMSKRLTSRFHLIATPELTERSVRNIFTSILSGFLGQWGDSMSGLAQTLVAYTCQVFKEVSANMLPIPAKSHYTFNLRDTGKVIQGILEVSPETTSTAHQLTRLWCHEATRVFHDRLTDDADRAWWWDLLRRLLGDSWDESLTQVLFCDFIEQDPAPQGGGRETDGEEGGSPQDGSGEALPQRVYQEVLSQDSIVSVAVKSQEEHRVKHKSTIDLVYFKSAVEHLARIARVIRLPRGHALLVGVGGSGRQSLTTIAAHICKVRLAKIAISKNYTLTEFRNDLKELVLEAGQGGTPVAFLLTDTQIIDEAMLEDINNLLNTGEVPNLLQSDDTERIVMKLSALTQGSGEEPLTRSGLLTLFTQRCRSYLKIVLAVSPVGDKFRERLRMFPSLVNCMTIDWFTQWPEDALMSVAGKALSAIPAAADLSDKLSKLCVAIHTDVKDSSDRFLQEHQRYNHTTPTSYLALLSSYREMLDEHSEKTDINLSKYAMGLEKLFSTQEIVDKLKDSLRQMQPELEKAKVETTELMETVKEEQVEADVLRATCKQSEEETQKIMHNAARIKDECQEGLDKAMPAFYSALDALKSLNKSDIIEIKSMSSPPSRVKLVIEAVQLLLGEKPGWDNAKKMMGQSGFIERLREYDKDNVSQATLTALQTFIENAEFQPDIVKKSSVAAMSLCLWVRAMDNYSAVAKHIEPKKEQLRVAEAELEAARAKLHAAQASLQEVELKVKALQDKMEAAVERKESLEEQQRVTVVKLGRAETLMNGLSSEQQRWVEAKESLQDEKHRLLGTILLAAGCVAYIGPFTSAFRSEMVSHWIDVCKELAIPCAANFSLDRITDPVKVRQWGIDGLPLDSFSIENAAIISAAKRWPLCIDPQAQASVWIRNTEKANGLRIVKPSDPNFMRVLETGIRIGAPVLLEDVKESFDPSLEPVLQRSTYKSPDGRLLLKLGDQEVDYDPNFRLIITTKLPNPHYLPEVQIKVTVVNFTVTPKGLEDQLLADVVRCEREDLQRQQDGMVVQIAQAKDQLASIENNILQLLAAATGNILDDEVLINTLSDSKVTAASISDNLQQVERTSAEISEAREKYRPVAARGSALYTSISTAASMSHMYQYSLDFFKALFNMTLRRTEQVPDVFERVSLLIPAITLDTYKAVCRGLFERDKPIFAFLVAIEVIRSQGGLSPDEWRCFLSGGTGGSLRDVLQEIESVASLPGLCESILTDASGAWAGWKAGDTPHCTPLPDPFGSLTAWQRLLVLRALRQDKVVFGVTEVAREVLGEEFADSPPFDLQGAFGDSAPATPLILVLTAGTDPTSIFLEFAEEKGFQEKKLMLSLGQDQGTKAEQLIKQGASEGQWVYLQNCHVYGSWMPSLERALETLCLKPGEIHPDFRLWLTTMPSDSFPVSILQNGVKITREPPRGLRANIRGSFNAIVKNTSWGSATPEWRTLIYCLTFFHGIIQERRRYGALGWNVRYEWSDSDLHASVLTLQTYLADTASCSEIPWAGLEYLTGVIHYGGRVTDFIDLKCLQALLKRYVSPEVLSGDNGHNFSDDGVYRVPPSGELSDEAQVRSLLTALPGIEMPEVFGLHSNADIVLDRNSSKRVLSVLAGSASSQSGSSSDGAKLNEVVTQIQGALPQPVDTSSSHPDTYAVQGDTIVPLGTFCRQEISVMNSLVSRVSSSLRELRSVLRGEAIMSSDMERMVTAVLLNRVPDAWHKGGYLSLKGLASWVRDTCQRVEALRRWNDSGPPERYWVPGYFFPQGFMTALLQTYSRKHRVPIDEVVFGFTVLSPEADVAGLQGAVTFGYFLEGAAWDAAAGSLRESTRGQLFTEMPDILLQPVRKAKGGAVGGAQRGGSSTAMHACPLYKTSSRAGSLSTTGLSTNFVLSVDLPTGAYPMSHWVLRGAALLCMLDD